MLKSNLIKFFGYARGYFFIPLCFLMSSTLLLINFFELLPTKQQAMFWGGIIFGFLGMIILFYTTPKNNTLKNEILRLSPFLFIISCFYNYIFNLDIFTSFSSTFEVILVLTSIMFGIFTFVDTTKKELGDEPEILNKSNSLNSKERKLYLFGLLLILSLGFYLRVDGLDKLSFWVDEANTVIVAERIANGFGQTLLSGDTYPRGYIYHHYIAALIKFKDYPNLIGRLANIPFFIGIVFLIYTFGKYIKNKRVGILSAFLFSFSWFGISMARDLRFYEMFLFLFLLLSYLILKILINYFNLSMEKRSLINIIKDRKIIMQGFFIIIISLISFDTQAQTALIIYPLILFGLFLSFFHKKTEGIKLFIFSFLVLVAATIYNSNEVFFKLSYLIIPPPPDWKVGFGNLGFFDFLNYLLINGYWYLIIIIPSLILFIVYKKDIKITFLGCMLFGLYFITSIQGYGLIAIRYYYLWFPFLLIGISYCIVTLNDYLFKKKIIFLTLIGVVIYLTIGINTITMGINESKSAYLFNSKNEPRNINYGNVFYIFQKHQMALQKEYSQEILSVTDNELGMPFYKNTGKLPDMIFQLNSKIGDQKNRYLNVDYIYFEELNLVKQPILAIFFKKKKYFINNNNETIDPIVIEYFDKNGSKIYDDGSILVYFINSNN